MKGDPSIINSRSCDIQFIRNRSSPLLLSLLNSAIYEEIDSLATAAWQSFFSRQPLMMPKNIHKSIIQVSL